MAGSEVVSNAMGTVSIACWLGAQLPQIVVNYKRRSVDGLSLAFLANWFAGDGTNLIGCLLTDQLPFQTYLASYFVCVDIMLLIQYLYYDATAPPRETARSRSRNTSMLRSRSASNVADLESAAINVAIAASEVQTGAPYTTSRWRTRKFSLEGLPESVVASAGHFAQGHAWGGRAPSASHAQPHSDEGDPEYEDDSALMVQSFLSEGGGGRGKRVSWSRDGLPEPDRDVHAQDQQPRWPSRGRQLTRSAVYDPPLDIPPYGRSRRQSTGGSSTKLSKRGAGVVFLSVMAVMGWGSVLKRPSKTSAVGVVLDHGSVAPDEANLHAHLGDASADADWEQALTFTEPVPHPSPPPPEKEEQLHLIGRISAWACATLYLTSRLPQIWKNFARKSCEGLSMYLFTFAFLGNFFYVLSILLNPRLSASPPQASEYLRESVPYLMGSAGTLMFDVTIVTQSFLYDPKRKLARRRKRRKSATRDNEEGRRLLDG